MVIPNRQISLLMIMAVHVFRPQDGGLIPAQRGARR